MENKLHRLFDYQKFQGNKRLDKMIAEAENLVCELNDDDLSLVAAAGETDPPEKEDMKNDT